MDHDPSPLSYVVFQSITMSFFLCFESFSVTDEALILSCLGDPQRASIDGIDYSCYHDNF